MAVVTILVAGVYVALAVSGLRRIEQAWLEGRALGDLYRAEIAALSTETVGFRITAGDTVEDRVRRITLDYADAIGTLADEADDVFALDPRVRRAQAAIVDELRSVVRDSQAAADNVGFTLGPFPYEVGVKPHLEAAMARWRLDPGTAPEPVPLPAMSRRRTATPLHDEPTGTRLLTQAGETLFEIDVDGGRVSRLGRGGVVVAVAGRLVVLEAGEAKLRMPGGDDRVLGEADDILRDGDDRSSVWLSRWDEDRPEFVVRRISLDTKTQMPAQRFVGHPIAGAGRWVAITPIEADGFTVHDLERPAFRFRRPTGTVHALAGGTLVWTDRTQSTGAVTMVVRDLARGVDRRIAAPETGAAVDTVAFGPGNRTVAVAWHPAPEPPPTFGPPDVAERPGQVWLYNLDDLHGRATPLASGPFNSALTWSPDGRFLFALTQAGSLRRSTILVHRVGTAVAEPLHIEGEFHTLAAL